MPTNNTSKPDLGQTLQRLENKFGFSVSSSEELRDSREIRRSRRFETPPPRINDLRASDESSIQDFIKSIRKKYLDNPEPDPTDNIDYKTKVDRVLNFRSPEQTIQPEKKDMNEPLIDLSSPKREPLDLLTPVKNFDLLDGLKFSPPRNNKHAHTQSVPAPILSHDPHLPDFFINDTSAKNEFIDVSFGETPVAKPGPSPTKKSLDITSLRQKRRLLSKKTPLQILVDSPEKAERDERFDKPMRSPQNMRPVQSSPTMKSIPSHLESILNATISEIITERLKLRPLIPQPSSKSFIPKSPTKFGKSFMHKGSPEKNGDAKQIKSFDEYLQSHATQSLKNKFSPLKTTPIKRKVDMNRIFETDSELQALLKREREILSRINSIDYEIKQIKTREDSLI